MGYEQLVGLKGQERIEMLRKIRAEVQENSLPDTPIVHEGLVSPEVFEFVIQWGDTDLANDEEPNEKRQRAQNNRTRKRSMKARRKHNRYWERPTEWRARA